MPQSKRSSPLLNAHAFTAFPMESLEGRALLAAGPRVVDVFADNRGAVVLTFDKALNVSTVNASSVQLLTSGTSPKPSTATYDAATKQLSVKLNGKVKANTHYTIKLVASKLKGADGAKLDGEFTGNNKTSGNGKAGGDFVARTAVSNKLHVARLSTTVGDIDFKLFHKDTPLAVANFEGYVNRGDYDGTFFHRFIKDFGMVGGSHFPKPDNVLGEVKQRQAIRNEPKPGKPGNVFGTIAVNRDVDGNPQTTNDRNSGKSQWFVNFGDNRTALDRYEGGTAVFGKVLNKTSKENLLKLNRQATAVRFGGGFSQLPIRDKAVLDARGGNLEPQTDLFFINRASVEMTLVAVTTLPAGTRLAASFPPEAARLSNPFASLTLPIEPSTVIGDETSEEAFA